MSRFACEELDDPESDLDAATTFPPKNLRSSASPSRCASDAPSNENRAFDFWVCSVVSAACLSSGYFTESSASALSRSSS